jgi:alpha-D-xyloside xylohydrolase
VVGERAGAFPGMLKRRTFHVVLVGPQHGTGVGLIDTPDRVLAYDGSRLDAF